MNVKELINEWFYRLPRGYAEPPYTTEELNTLEVILKEWNISNFKTVLSYLSETDKELPQKTDDSGGEPEPEPETHESNEDFRNLLDSFEQFSDIVNRRYVSTGIEVKNLDEFFKKISGLPDSLRDQMRRIIGKRTNRDLLGGTFKMGQYEKMLYDIVKDTVIIENSHPYVLWLAMVLNGKVKGTAGSSSVSSNVVIDQSNVYIGNFHNEVISFGTIDPEIASILSILVNLGEVIDGTKLDEFSKSNINELLKKLSDDSNKEELDQFLNLSNTTKLTAIKSLSNAIKTSLENHDINSLPEKFCQLLDSFISKVLADVQYWITIRGDMCYMAAGDTLYPSLNCTKENRLGGGIFSIRDNILYVLGDIINEKLV